MREGNIILTAITQADERRENRPALVLREMPKYGDLLICGISTQVKQYIPNFDEIIMAEDYDFIDSGLISKSLIRLAFLAVVPQAELIGSIGKISSERHFKLLSNLSIYLTTSTHE